MYTNKIVVVAGGTGSVGEGIAKWFISQGATVIIPTRNITKIAKVQAYIAPNNKNLHFIEGNIADETDAIRIRDEILATYGQIDAMVSSLFGWWSGAKLTELSLERWNYIINSSLTTHFIVAKTFIPYIVPRGSYSFIVGLSSVRPVPHSGPISVANAAELMLRRVLSAENDPQQIRINDINLGPINTRSRGTMYSSPDYIDAVEVGRIAGIIAFEEGNTISDTSISLRLKTNYREWLAQMNLN